MMPKSTSLREKLEKLEVPSLHVNAEAGKRITTGHLTIKTIDEILDLLAQEVKEYKEALEDMIWQYAYKSDGAGRKPPMMFTGGMSALEHAFGVLDWPDPKPCPDSSCDIKGCQRWPGCGMSRPDGDYWNICGHHMGLIDMGDTSLEKKPGRGYNAKERKDRLERLG